MACQYSLSRGYDFVANVSLEPKSGVGLLFKRPWSFVRSFSVSTRLMVVVLRHCDNFDVAFVVGHFYNRPHECRAQWSALGEHVRLLAGLPIIFLADHIFILCSLDGTRVNVWSQNELQAMEAERATLGAMGLLDAWVKQFPDREAPGYIKMAVPPSAGDTHSQKVSRCIDKISVTDDLLKYGISMFTSPVGFSDHPALVLQFIGMGLGGPQPNAGNHLEERLLHQARVRASYTPPVLGSFA